MGTDACDNWHVNSSDQPPLAVNASSAPEVDLMQAHIDAVEDENRFGYVVFGSVEWDLSHLNPFALRIDVGDGLVVDVVVLFSCHCFTRGQDASVHVRLSELYQDGRETRVLDEERYQLSRKFLPQLIRDLPTRRILVAQDRGNFFTFEATDSGGAAVQYAVFFELLKDARRKKRLILRVQTAYPLAELNNRQRQARKVNFGVLVRAVHEGRKIRG